MPPTACNFLRALLRPLSVLPQDWARTRYAVFYIIIAWIGWTIGVLLWAHARCITLLHTAVRFRICPSLLVRALALIGVDPNARTVQRQTALHLARGGAAAKALLKCNADPAVRDNDNNTALHAAAAREDGAPVAKEVLDYIAAHKAEHSEAILCALNKGGHSPLHVALREGTEATIWELLQVILKFAHTRTVGQP